MRSLLVLAALSCGFALADESAPARTDPPLPLAGAPPAAAHPSTLQAVAGSVQEMKAAASAFGGVTCTLRKTEYKGRQFREEQVLLKLRNHPRAIYMKWIGAEHRGQEVIWREGWNRGRLRAHKGSFPDVTVDLAPTSGLAMRDSRHPVTQVGFDFMLSVLERDLALAEATPACLVNLEDAGKQDVLGAPARCFEVDLDKARCPQVYAWRARFCQDQSTRLPSRVQVWDQEGGEVRLVEDFTYQGITLEPGLTDRDFDPDRYAFESDTQHSLQ
jgi:hypothetical protein